MIYTFNIALKNIIRAKRRTVLTFVMLSFAIMIYLVVEGMLQGFDDASFQNMIDFETGHIKIRSKTFDEDHPYDIENYLNNTSSLITQLRYQTFVTGAAPRIQFLAQVDNGIDTSPAVVVGIDPAADRGVFSLEKYISSGSLTSGGVILGKSLASDMELGVGDLVFVTFRDKNGMYTSIELFISGLVYAPDPRVNNATAFITIDEAREYLSVAGATEIALKTMDYEKARTYKKLLLSKFSRYRIETWREISTDFAALMETKRKASAVILLFIVVIALVGIINTLLMSVYEKRQEIGTLMALGMEHREVRNIFMMEGLIIGLAGSIVGLFIGTLVNLYFIYVGIDYTALMGENLGGFNVLGVVKSAWVFPAYLKSVVIVVTACVLSSYYPAKKVMTMEPAECLRTVQ